ncbi:MAG: hypothetical protein K2N54_08680, partial [Helicobacter sp.]|nr:hypothetical protein [Helicobacter sp.]
FDPQTPARFLKVCAPHGLCRTPQRFVSIIAYGTYGDVARCGWEIGIKSNGKEMFWLCLNMTRFHCHCERVQRAWQSTSNESKKNPTRLIATRLTPLAMTDND